MSAGIIRPTGIVILTLAALGAASCGSSAKPAAVATTSSTTASTSSTTTSTPPTTTTTGALGTTTTTSPGLSNWVTPALDPNGSIPIATFNTRVDAANPTWATSPERVADEFVNTDNVDASSTSTQVIALSPQGAEVVVTVNGLRDDSVHAIKYDLHLARRPDQTWRLAAAEWSQQCQPGRGHQNFTPALCV